MKNLQIIILILFTPLFSFGQAPKGNDAEHFLKKTRNIDAQQTKKIINEAYNELIIHNENFGYSRVDRYKKHYDGKIYHEQVGNLPSYIWTTVKPEVEINIRNEISENKVNFTQKFEQINETNITIVSQTRLKNREYLKYIIDTIFYFDGSIEVFSNNKEAIEANYNNFRKTNKIIDSISARPAYKIRTGFDSCRFKPENGKTYTTPGQKIKIINVEDNYIRYLAKDINTDKDIETRMYFINSKGKAASRYTSVEECFHNNFRPQDFPIDEILEKYWNLIMDMEKLSKKDKINQLIEKYLSEYIIFNEGDSLYRDYEETVSGNIDSIHLQSLYYTTTEVGKIMLHNLYTHNRGLIKTDIAYTEKKIYDEEEEEPDETMYERGIRTVYTNSAGKIIVPDPREVNLTEINYNYYSTSNNDKLIYWYFSGEMDRMEQLDVDKINPLSDYNTSNSVLTYENMYKHKYFNSAVIAEKNGKYALWGDKGKPLTYFIYDSIKYNNKNNLLDVDLNGKQLQINLQGEPIK